MARDTITGSRIRERRVMMELKQGELARQVGISASYLNLIEHNRRRIGGKLLLDIAASLGVEPSALTEGAEAALIEGLRAAAVGQSAALAEIDRVEEFASRFPGWAALVVRFSARIEGLEQSVATLSERLAHDPQLAASLHDVLSQVTSIRSTAAILSDTRELEPEWRDRFNRNVNEDSRKLAQSARALASYLDGAGNAAVDIATPQDEIDRFLEERSYHLSELEQPDAEPEDVESLVGVLPTGEGRAGLRAILKRYLSDARSIPLSGALEVLAQKGPDPSALMARFEVSADVALRRLACLPPGTIDGGIGLVVCDGAGAITFRRQIDGFATPKFGAGCPLWPLYQALAAPLTPISAILEQDGRDTRRFKAHAIAVARPARQFDLPPLLEATMIVMPPTDGDGPARQVGPNCRICIERSCPARREPSMLADRGR